MATSRPRHQAPKIPEAQGVAGFSTNALTATANSTKRAVDAYVQQLLQDGAGIDSLVQVLVRACIGAIFKHVGYEANPPLAGTDAADTQPALPIPSLDDGDAEYGDLEDAVYHFHREDWSRPSISRGTFVRDYFRPLLQDPAMSTLVLSHLNLAPQPPHSRRGARIPVEIAAHECPKLLTTLLTHAVRMDLDAKFYELSQSPELSLFDVMSVLAFIEGIGDEEAARWFGWHAFRKGITPPAAAPADGDIAKGIKLVKLFTHIMKHLTHPWTRTHNPLPLDPPSTKQTEVDMFEGKGLHRSIRFRMFGYYAKAPAGQEICKKARAWGSEWVGRQHDKWFRAVVRRWDIASNEEVEKKADMEELEKQVEKKADKEELEKQMEQLRAHIQRLEAMMAKTSMP